MNNIKRNQTKEQKYLDELHIDQGTYNYLITSKGRTGNRGTTKFKWRDTDNIDYPVITYNISELEENSAHE